MVNLYLHFPSPRFRPDTEVHDELMQHLDGVPWWRCQIKPTIFHFHRVQTRIYLDRYGSRYVDRCRCAASRDKGGRWTL